MLVSATRPDRLHFPQKKRNENPQLNNLLDVDLQRCDVDVFGRFALQDQLLQDTIEQQPMIRMRTVVDCGKVINKTCQSNEKRKARPMRKSYAVRAVRAAASTGSADRPASASVSSADTRTCWWRFSCRRGSVQIDFGAENKRKEKEPRQILERNQSERLCRRVTSSYLRANSRSSSPRTMSKKSKCLENK